MSRIVAAGVAAVGLALTGLAGAAPNDTYTLTANLNARAEVPKPRGVPARAVGLFRGRATEGSNDRATLTWRLTFRRLSGRAVAAHVHAGRPGRAGAVLAPLCGPCRSGQRGTTRITHRQLRTIRARGAYVNIHTARNPAGEIRGQLRASQAPSSSSPSPPPDPSPDPPPYPPYP